MAASSDLMENKSGNEGKHFERGIREFICCILFTPKQRKWKLKTVGDEMIFHFHDKFIQL
jgi:hypothetical protein